MGIDSTARRCPHIHFDRRIGRISNGRRWAPNLWRLEFRYNLMKDDPLRFRPFSLKVTSWIRDWVPLLSLDLFSIHHTVQCVSQFSTTLVVLYKLPPSPFTYIPRSPWNLTLWYPEQSPLWILLLITNVNQSLRHTVDIVNYSGCGNIGHFWNVT